MLDTIAELERRSLNEPERAVETYRVALDVNDSDGRALDALTELYQELHRHRDLADLYLRRAEAATSGEQAAPFRLALARLLRSRLDDTAGAIDQLEAIVTAVPWHTEAIKELEGFTHEAGCKARVVEILRPLYERSDDWRLLVRLNEERFGLAELPREKVAVLRETARLWEARGGDTRKAMDATRVAFELDPEDTDTRAELERLTGLLGTWDELAASYEAGSAAVTDEVTKRDLLVALAKTYDNRLDDPRRALNAFARLSALDPVDPEPLEAMDTLSVLLSDWTTLIAVLEKKSANAGDVENAAIWRRIAEVKLDMLDDIPGAIAAHERALEFGPESPATVDALIALYDAETSARRLVELFARRVELSEPNEANLRYELNLRAAECYEKQLNDRREAISALGAALEARPGDPAVLKALERLYRAERMWDDLLGNLKLQVASAESIEARVALRTAMGDLYAAQLENPNDALDQYRLVLELEPQNNHAIASARRIGEAREDLRLPTADILEPVLRAGKRYEEVVGILSFASSRKPSPPSAPAPCATSRQWRTRGGSPHRSRVCVAACFGRHAGRRTTARRH